MIFIAVVLIIMIPIIKLPFWELLWTFMIAINKVQINIELSLNWTREFLDWNNVDNSKKSKLNT